MQGAAKGCSGASGASVQRGDNGVTPDAPVAVGAVITEDEHRALRELMTAFTADVETGDWYVDFEAVASGLRKLLAEPTGLPCCYIERARVIKLLNEQVLDETPTNRDPSPLAMVRDAGYRAGWNDRARSLAKELAQ
jgi:hypothetical protein